MERDGYRDHRVRRREVTGSGLLASPRLEPGADHTRLQTADRARCTAHTVNRQAIGTLKQSVRSKGLAIELLGGLSDRGPRLLRFDGRGDQKQGC